MRQLLAAAILLAAGLHPAFAADGKLVLYTSQPNTDAQQTTDAFIENEFTISGKGWMKSGGQ